MIQPDPRRVNGYLLTEGEYRRWQEGADSRGVRPFVVIVAGDGGVTRNIFVVYARESETAINTARAHVGRDADDYGYTAHEVVFSNSRTMALRLDLDGN